MSTNAVLINGDCLEILKDLPDASVDSLVTDPPAGISFMGKAWDDDKGGRRQWIEWMTEVMREALRVLKPGAHGLVWALPRTSHWTATALEDAGFEVRDVVTHLFGTGFPKSMDISKAIDKAAGANRVQVLVPTKPGNHKGQAGAVALGASGMTDISEPVTDDAKEWQGWGTALKPASEHWILVRKPCSEKTVAANVLKWGVGGINIDKSRIELNGDYKCKANGRPSQTGLGDNYDPTKANHADTVGRFPANLVLDEEAASALDEQSGELQSGSRKQGVRKGSGFHGAAGDGGPAIVKSSGGASRFFYVAKASKSDKGADNNHPTVKSRALMTYLINLVTPPEGIVLDPFMGSGSTGVAARAAGFDFIGIEKDEGYYAIAENRVDKEVA